MTLRSGQPTMPDCMRRNGCARRPKRQRLRSPLLSQASHRGRGPYPRPGLRYHRRSDGYIYFQIGHADDFHGALNAFKERVPGSARRYSSGKKEWRIPLEYEPVLAELFTNYSRSGSRNTRPSSARPAASTSKPTVFGQERGSKTARRVGTALAAIVLAISSCAGHRTHRTAPPRLPSSNHLPPEHQL